MTQLTPRPPVHGPLEDYALQFDDLFSSLAQRRGFRTYLQGLLLPRDRNKSLKGLVGTEPVVGARAAPVRQLQFFISDSLWDFGSREPAPTGIGHGGRRHQTP